jgi:hypothetical protein
MSTLGPGGVKTLAARGCPELFSQLLPSDGEVRFYAGGILKAFA